jgi:hypothetical protein
VRNFDNLRVFFSKFLFSLKLWIKLTGSNNNSIKFMINHLVCIRNGICIGLRGAIADSEMQTPRARDQRKCFQLVGMEEKGRTYHSCEFAIIRYRVSCKEIPNKDKLTIYHRFFIEFERKQSSKLCNAKIVIFALSLWHFFCNDGTEHLLDFETFSPIPSQNWGEQTFFFLKNYDRSLCRCWKFTRKKT